MKIQKLTVDDGEVKEAVRTYLKTKGIDMPIYSVLKDYSWKTEWEVTFEFEVEPIPKAELPIAVKADGVVPETKEVL